MRGIHVEDVLNKSNILMGLGLHSCGMWLHHRLIEARLFETTKWSHLEEYNIRRRVSGMFYKKTP